MKKLTILKKLVKSGYFFLNYLKNKIKINRNYKKTILFAPTWSLNKKNLFNDYGKEIIKKLIELNYKVILRPHPEIGKRFPNKINEVKKFFQITKIFILINLHQILKVWKSRFYV